MDDGSSSVMITKTGAGADFATIVFLGGADRVIATSDEGPVTLNVAGGQWWCCCERARTGRHNNSRS